MRIVRAKLINIGAIRSLILPFSPTINIICGPNGIGKSTILDAISFLFTRNGSDVKKNIRSKSDGMVKIVVKDGNNILQAEGEVTTYSPDEQPPSYRSNIDIRYLLRFNTERHFSYAPLENISMDPIRDEFDISTQNNRGISLNDLKAWLGKRYLLSHSTNNFFSHNSQRNLELALGSIKYLNADYTFSHIDGRNFDIFVNTPDGVIWYEYLSSGFKSCMALIIGIIKEIEFRFTEEDIYARDFEGMIIIDEIEMHLHPEWQGKITEILSQMFPYAQFIITTHSPHVVQNSKSSHIIALEKDKDGEINVREQLFGHSGYKGWTIDEVLRDVMGMESTLSRELESRLKQFYQFVDSENIMKARESYNYLDKILHPKNVLRKSLRMSMNILEDSGEME